MTRIRQTFSTLLQRWASFIAGQEVRWRETLRSEGVDGEDAADPLPAQKAPSCGTKPETPSLLKEVGKLGSHVRHDDRR